jgi:hypothetical protein
VLAAVSKKYGGGTNYKAIWNRMNQIKANAKLIDEAIEAGADPITVQFNETLAQASKQPRGSYVAISFVSMVSEHSQQISFRFK